MDSTNWTDEIKTLLETNEDAWDALDGDGHSIMFASFYLERGWPEAFISDLITVHESDPSSYKETIFDNDGNVLDRLEGIYSLSFHRKVGALFDCNADSRIFGRGSQARDIAYKLREKFGRVKSSVG